MLQHPQKESSSTSAERLTGSHSIYFGRFVFFVRSVEEAEGTKVNRIVEVEIILYR